MLPTPRPSQAVLQHIISKPVDSLQPFINKVLSLASGYGAVENGFCTHADGSATVHIHTEMPAVAPHMWHWWFGWHGSSSDRYKLWHPKAHVSARWLDGHPFESYIGRTSIIEEYIGQKLEKAAITFKDPCEFGLQNTVDQVYICARLGYSQLPIDYGYLVHQVRKTSYGAEMRSRFYIGGPHIALRGSHIFGKLVSAIIRNIKTIKPSQAKALMLHCSEEMNHLAQILPDLYTKNHPVA
jgi:hypothetical protein